MTQTRRLLLAGAITIMTALALFAVVANTGAFGSSDASSSPPVDLSVDGTAFVADESGQSTTIDQAQYEGSDNDESFESGEGWVDGDDREGGDDGDHDDAEHQDNDEHDEHDDDD